VNETRASSLVSQKDVATLRSFASRVDASDAGAHNNLGVLYHRKGLHEEAVAAFTRALELDPKMLVAQRNLEIAYFETGYYERRVTELRERLRGRPGDTDARWELGRVYSLLGQLPEAFAELEALLARDPSDTRVLLQLALAEKGTGDLARAQVWLERALAIDANDATLVFHLGEVLYNRGMSVPALELLERAVQLAPEHADAHYVLAFVLGDLNRHEEARAATKRAMQLNPSLSKARANLSLERTTPGSSDPLVASRMRASAELAREMAVSPGDALAHFNLGLAFRAKGYWAEAMREYRLALDRGEDRGLVLQAMAEVYLLEGKASAACQLYARLVDERADSPKLWNEHGVALHQDGRAEDALECYLRSLSIDPRYALARNNLGVALAHLGRADDALRALDAALAERPAFAKAGLNRALLLASESRRDAALEAYHAVLRHDPPQPLVRAAAWNGAGAVLSSTRRFEEARAAFARAIDAQPDYAPALYNLSFALSNLGDFDGALKATKRALELDPYYTPQRFELVIDLEFEDPDLGVPVDLASARRSDEPLAEFSVDRATLDHVFGELAPAPAGATEAEPATFDVAVAMLGERRWDDAIVEVVRALAAGADRAEGLALLGDAYAGRGALGEALERYRATLAEMPGHRAASIGEVRVSIALGRGADVVSAADGLAARMPMDAGVLLLAARAHADAGDDAGAWVLIDAAARVAAERGDAVAEIADAERRMGDAERAIESSRRALALDPTLADARVELALLLERGRSLDDAAGELARSLADRPTHVEATHALARVQRALGRVDESMTLLVEHLRGDPFDVEALVSLAESLMHGARLDDAAHALARARRLDPEHAGAIYYEGVIAAERHRWREAIERWRLVVELEPAGEYARRARRDARTAADLEHIFTSSAA
jgi:tetratricopeptide (TPR) repeat protein